ncbi:exodeoxyribonuclease VII large subunit [Chryseolinea sp. T2]|uniref:exodeoxyribonuclease VII large subunit n=1 Tax=Chryseolinea sp. T2 TaxID=3129255 RepID=UPI0030779AD3
MAIQVDDKKVFSLLEVTNSVRKTIAERYQSTFWVKAEMNKLNHYTYSGHCYPELVEKNNGRVVAQLRASLWKDDYIRANAKFLQALGEPLKDGISILFEASLGFDPVHGFSLRIIDIDPIFSLGALERERLESIARLKAMGIFDKNKHLKFPTLPKRIAVISVETSKGYSDFMKVIEGNPWGYRFSCFLFPALLQGDRSVDSILTQLQRIRKVLHHFDVVALIRGGGGDVGLSSYNSFRLASEVARFPIPLMTGIGHSTNETVVEMVAHRNAITPTELGDFLIQRLHEFAAPVARATEIIADRSRRLLLDESRHFDQTVRSFRRATINVLNGQHRELQNIAKGISQSSLFSLRRTGDRNDRLAEALRRSVMSFIQHQRIELTGWEKTIGVMDPVHVLKRGFTITTVKGKVVKSVGELNIGDTLITTAADGSVTSQIVSKDEHA